MVRRALVLVVVAAACKSTRAPKGPSDIAAACVATDDGATCTFTNKSGEGSRCVRVLRSGPPDTTVAVSDEVCSGKLAAGEVNTVPAKFAKLTACDDCTAQLSDPRGDVAKAQADVLADELEERSLEGPPDRKSCEERWQHEVDLRYRERVRHASPEERQRADEWRTSTLQYDAGWNVDSCVSSSTKKKVQCALAAKTVRELDQCR